MGKDRRWKREINEKYKKFGEIDWCGNVWRENEMCLEKEIRRGLIKKNIKLNKINE
jgi:hypothetical protein